MYDTNAVNAVTRAMRSEVSDHVTASEKKSLREVLAEALRVIPKEEAYPGPIGLRLDAVKNYVKMIGTSRQTTFVLVLKLSE